jgi:hypothetical protein
MMRRSFLPTRYPRRAWLLVDYWAMAGDQFRDRSGPDGNPPIGGRTTSGEERVGGRKSMI